MATPASTKPPAVGLASAEDAELLFQQRIRHAVEVGQPLVLISQMQRSGGTLLSEFFDGHPQLHAHPYELHIGFPTKYDWPRIDLEADPETWYEQLREEVTERYFVEGYRKYARKHVAYEDEQLESHPFTLVPSLQRSLFLELGENREIARERDVLDVYMTSYFNAWLDNQNLYGDDKRWVVGFCPRLAWGEGRAAFFDTYPDGRLISSLRDPKGFFASARRAYPQKYGDINEAIGLWRIAAEEILAAKRERPDQVHVVAFEQLLGDTERVMSRLAERLGIGFDPILTRPTFNRRAIKANSSFRIEGHGVLDAPLDRHRRELSDEEIGAIDDWTSEVYAEARSLVDA